MLLRILCALILAALGAVADRARAQDVCANPATACGRMISPACQRLGAGSQETGCEAQFGAYRACLRQVAERCTAAAPAGPGACAASEADKLWAEAKADNDCYTYEAFVQACPESRFSLIAKARMRRLKCAAPPSTPAPSAAARAPAPPVETPPNGPAFPGEAEIRTAQQELRRLGFYRGRVDGDWGPDSQTAMRRFQQQAGRSADGRLTEASLAALKAAPTPAAPTRTARPGSTFRDCPVCPEMVEIPGGVFTMGSPESEPERRRSESPQRRVRIQPFALAKHEVTRGAFARFVREAGHKIADGCWTWEDGEGSERAGRSFRNAGFAQSDRHPVVCVSWSDAQAYVRWLNGKVSGSPYRLPSEAELEYAIRAGRTAAYAWRGDKNAGCRDANGADQAGKRDNPGWTRVSACDDGYAATAEVGSFRPNAFGMYDLVGNVWEWAQDCWNDNYQGAPATGSAWMSGDCARAVLRGGSWYDGPRWLRSASRGGNRHGDRFSVVGFRVARTVAR